MIRPAVIDDSKRIAELSGVLGYPVTQEAVEQRLGRLLNQPSQLVLVAELAPGLVVGWLHAAEQELLESGQRCEILGLVVEASRRRTGAGKKLVEAAERWARGRGLDQMTVRSNVARTESHPFYERLGYVRNKTQHAYGKRLS